MSTLSRILPTRTDTFDAWRIVDGKSLSHPLPTASTTLPEVIADVVGRCHHKDKLAIRCVDAIQDTTRLLIYGIKRQTRPDYRTGERVQPLYAELLFEIEVAAFEPIVPWTWSPGADVVGAGSPVIEAVQL